MQTKPVIFILITNQNFDYLSGYPLPLQNQA